MALPNGCSRWAVKSVDILHALINAGKAVYHRENRSYLLSLQGRNLCGDKGRGATILLCRGAITSDPESAYWYAGIALGNTK